MRKRIAPMSKEMKASRAEYAREVSRWKAGKRCVRCSGWRNITCHHWKGRIGPLLLDKRFWIPICIDCHRWADNHIQEAREKNYFPPAGLYNETEDKGIRGLRFTPCGIELIKS